MLNSHNYWLLTGIIGKPWTHTMCLGFAMIMMQFYRNLIEYRYTKPGPERDAAFPIINKLQHNKCQGMMLNALGVILIVGNLTLPYEETIDPQISTKMENAIYYAISRPLWVFGTMILIVSIFTGHFNFGKALLSNGNLVLLAKLGGVSTLVVILSIHLIFNSSQMEAGLFLTFPVALLFGLGFIFSSTLLSLFVMLTIEFPLKRLYQITIMPILSHDILLARWYISENKFDEIPEDNE